MAGGTGGQVPGGVEDARLWAEGPSSHAQAEDSGRHRGTKEESPSSK